MSDSSEESNLDVCDQSVLADAEQILKDISPQKVTGKKKKSPLGRPTKLSDLPKGSQRKSKVLKKSDVQTICKHLNEEKDSILFLCKTQILDKQFWDAMDGYRCLITSYTEQKEFLNLCETIHKDYLIIYDNCNKGRSKYQDFQIDCFKIWGNTYKTCQVKWEKNYFQYSSPIQRTSGVNLYLQFTQELRVTAAVKL